MAEKHSLPVASWFSGHLPLLQPAKLAFMERCEREFPLDRFRIYHRPLFVVSDPELIAEVSPDAVTRPSPNSGRALAWTLYLIGTHPEVEARIKSELAAALGGSLPGSDVARRLPYLHHVLLESLRLYPSIPILGRAAARDTRIGDVNVPKGSEVLISPWAIHRSSRHYEDPLAFRPERWTPEFERALPRYAYMPFSGGPRVCMGQYMAVQESMQILATLLQFAELRPVEGRTPVLDAGMTAVPRRGTLQLRVRDLRGPRAPIRSDAVGCAGLAQGTAV